ncbi:hypothetical protein HYX10_02430 [Candidatus Woesearchaeota archaeon]|nr:hypothetical protein [Candidatus Woesearchaeota archaeon]
MMARFQKTVSKGSRFNQIYVPKDMEGLIEAGDMVEVRLVKKHAQLHYPAGLERLSEFKEKLIGDVFSFLSGIDRVERIFVVGSFLTEKVSYNDIDLVLIVSGKSDGFEESVHSRLTDKFNLKFHIIAIEKERFERLLKICPLTKSMFSSFVCNRPIELPDERLVDRKHIRFLLMMPQDLLHVRLGSRVFFDNLRRVVTIERFLRNESLNSASINREVKKLVKGSLYDKLRASEEIEENSVAFLRKLIRAKLASIEGLI